MGLSHKPTGGVIDARNGTDGDAIKKELERSAGIKLLFFVVGVKVGNQDFFLLQHPTF